MSKGIYVKKSHTISIEKPQYETNKQNMTKQDMNTKFFPKPPTPLKPVSIEGEKSLISHTLELLKTITEDVRNRSERYLGGSQINMTKHIMEVTTKKCRSFKKALIKSYINSTKDYKT